MREIVHLQAGQCGNQIGAKVYLIFYSYIKIITYFQKKMSTVKTVVYYSKCHLKKKKIGTNVREKFDDLIK